MELLTKTKEELLELAEKLKLNVPKNIPEDKLRETIETEAIRRTVEMEESARLRLQDQSKMKRDIAEIRAEASIRGINIVVPEKPTLTDIIKLKKKLNMMIKEPKPSPETIAIEKSKKVYAVFHNREQEDMDVSFCCGGKYWFHLWPEKIHVLPEWLIGNLRKVASVPVYDKKMVANPQSVAIDSYMEKSVPVSRKQRFLFEVLGDAPDDSSFGVVLDEKILSSLTIPTM